MKGIRARSLKNIRRRLAGCRVYLYILIVTKSAGRAFTPDSRRASQIVESFSCSLDTRAQLVSAASQAHGIPEVFKLPFALDQKLLRAPVEKETIAQVRGDMPSNVAYAARLGIPVEKREGPLSGDPVLLGGAYSGIEIKAVLHPGIVQRYERQGLRGLHSPQGAPLPLFRVDPTIIAIVFAEYSKAVSVRVAMSILSSRSVETSAPGRVERNAQGGLTSLVQPPGD